MEKEDDLFRKEVIEERKSSFFGNILLITPIKFIYWVLFSIFTLLSLLLFLYFYEYTSYTNVIGQIKANKNIKIISTNAGSITNINVYPGQSIQKGDELFSIYSIKSDITNNSIYQKYSLIKDFLSKVFYINKEEQSIVNKVFDKKITISHLFSNINELLSNLFALNDIFSINIGVLLNNLYNKFVFFNKNYNKIYSSVDGEISKINNTVGNFVNVGNTVLSIIPNDAILEGNIFIPVNLIHKVKPNNLVIFGFESNNGKVFFKSSIKCINNELSVINNYQNYIASIKIDDINDIERKIGYKLKDGMLFNAKIKGETKTLIKWILLKIKDIK